MKQFLKDHPGATTFQVDAGGLFNSRLPDDNKVRALWEGTSRLGVGIINLSPGDAAQLKRVGLPILAPGAKGPSMISANVLGADGKPLAPAYVVRRAADGTRLVFIGLSSVPQWEKFGYTVADPKETLKALLPRIRENADVVVLVIYTPNRELNDLVPAAPGVDLVVSGHETQFAVAPYQIGKTWILQSQYEGRLVGEAELKFSAAKGVEIAPNRIVALDSSFADDAEMAALLARLAPRPSAAPAAGKTQ